MTSLRPSWDSTWQQVAKVVAQRSLCDRDKVGAVIVDARNRIVATGYNGPPAGFEPRDADGDSSLKLGCKHWCERAKNSNPGEQWPDAPISLDYSDCPSLHAEANALSVCDRSVREGGTIYVTSTICFGCAKLIANSGLARVWVNTNRSAVHRNATRSYKFLRDCGIEVYAYGTG